MKLIKSFLLVLAVTVAVAACKNINVSHFSDIAQDVMKGRGLSPAKVQSLVTDAYKNGRGTTATSETVDNLPIAPLKGAMMTPDKFYRTADTKTLQMRLAGSIDAVIYGITNYNYFLLFDREKGKPYEPIVKMGQQVKITLFKDNILAKYNRDIRANYPAVSYAAYEESVRYHESDHADAIISMPYLRYRMYEKDMWGNVDWKIVELLEASAMVTAAQYLMRTCHISEADARRLAGSSSPLRDKAPAYLTYDFVFTKYYQMNGKDLGKMRTYLNNELRKCNKERREMYIRDCSKFSRFIRATSVPIHTSTPSGATGTPTNVKKAGQDAPFFFMPGGGGVYNTETGTVRPVRIL